ncbi:hypothetical protein BH23ACT6_BH23ACT6_10110 [soil metagenome]
MTSVLTRRFLPALALPLVLTMGACGGEDSQAGDGETSPAASSEQDAAESSDQGESNEQGEQLYPDIVDVEVSKEGDQSASFDVTVSSPYDTPQRYADGWRVLDQDGEVLGEHTLSHDHASEQPFTRTQSDVTIPDGTTELTIEGRDQVSGYGGETVTVQW